jgi:PAS domain S-box-containing protein
MSEQGSRAAKPAGGSDQSKLDFTSQVGGESWNYVSLATTVFALVSTALSGCVLGYLYGALPGAVWSVAAGAALLSMITMSSRLSAGDDNAAWPAIVSNILTVALWMGGAVALFVTGDPAAMVTATSLGWAWISHLLIGGQRNRLILFVTMSMPAAVVLYFLISTSWASYPFWIALAATGSALLTALTLAKSAEIANDNFQRLGAATSQAKAMRSKLEFAVESAGDGYFEVDLKTMTYMPNPKFARALGFEGQLKHSTKLSDFVHQDDIPAASINVDMCKDGLTDGWNQDLRIRVAGGYRWMSLRARVLEASDSAPRFLIGTLVDLTARKNLEADLMAAKEAAEASNRAKGEFLANMSHEIRTPLNGVLGMAQVLEAGDLSPADKEKVAVILDSGKSLMALLNDVLDLSKIEAGKMEIVPAPADFVHAMTRTQQLFEVQASEKGLELSLIVDAALPRQLSFDPVRVRQCVSNLLSNAVKFTARGRVEIALSACPLGDGEHLVAVRILDTGIGMSEEAVGRLFGAFNQADSSTTRRFGGSGLGLFISRQLARMMGGDIVVESREGVGSTFTLTFKAREAAASAPSVGYSAEASAPRSLRGARVLLADDNAINRQVIKLFIAPLGCQIAEAANGKEALERLASQPFDVVLLDVHMPVMDGKEAIQKIRAAQQPWSAVPVIALTADAMSGDRERYLELGMTDYVSKPVDQRELIAKLSLVLGLEAPAARSVA